MRRWHALSIAAMIAFATLAIPGRLLAQAPAAVSPDSPEAPGAGAGAAAGEGFHYFSFWNDPHYAMERWALCGVLLVALAGLVYAGMLVGQVLGRDQGTEKMRTVGRAMREGANASPARQFKAIIALVFLITAILY